MNLVEYVRVNFKNRIVSRPRTYTAVSNQDGSRTDTPAPGTVQQAGTPMNQATLNTLDKGIADCAAAINGIGDTLQEIQNALRETRTDVRGNASAIKAIQESNEQQSQRFANHLEDETNPHAVDLFQTAAEDFLNAWGDPAAVGTYIGNGSTQGTLTVNSTSVRGQQINLGFAPGKVAIFFPYQDLTIGYTESSVTQYNPLDIACGKKLGVVLIGPGLNYYHSGCGNLRTSTPQAVLSMNHGGAVVYGNGFIVQAYNNQDADTTMNVNSKNVRYMYLAWR